MDAKCENASRSRRLTVEVTIRHSRPVAAALLMRWTGAMRLTEGAIVHRINRTARINRTIIRARRIRYHLRTSFHASAPWQAHRTPARSTTRGKAEGLEWVNARETRVPPRLNALESRFHDVQACPPAAAGITAIPGITQVAAPPAIQIETRGKGRDAGSEKAGRPRHLVIEAAIRLSPHSRPGAHLRRLAVPARIITAPR